MFLYSPGVAWSMAVYSGKPFAGLMNQAPTKANYYYIDCRGSNSLRPAFQMNWSDTPWCVEPWVFILHKVPQRGMRVYPVRTVSRVKMWNCGTVELWNWERHPEKEY